MRGRRIDDTAGAGYFNFERAFYKSSNAYFIHYGLKLGPETIVDYGNQIFLEKSGYHSPQSFQALISNHNE